MSTTATTPETLAGSIERVSFHSPDNGFAVLRLKVKGHRDLVTVVGHLASAVGGEFVEASGQWVKRMTPMHRSVLGTRNLNQTLQDTLKSLRVYPELGSKPRWRDRLEYPQSHSPTVLPGCPHIRGRAHRVDHPVPIPLPVLLDRELQVGQAGKPPTSIIQRRDGQFARRLRSLPVVRLRTLDLSKT